MTTESLQGLLLSEESMEESEDEQVDEVTATTSQRGGKTRKHRKVTDQIRPALARAHEGTLIDGNELENWETELNSHYKAALTINDDFIKINPSKKTEYERWAIEFSKEHEEVLNELEEFREPLMTTPNKTPLTTPVGTPTESPTRGGTTASDIECSSRRQQRTQLDARPPTHGAESLRGAK